MDRVRYAKSETGTLRGRGATTAQRWSDAGDADRRVYLCPDSFVTVEDLAYIAAIAKERGESRSCALERMVWGWYSRGLYRYLPWYPVAHVRLPRSAHIVKMPKFTAHPATVSVLRGLSMEQGMPLSATLHLILRLHRVALS